MTPWNCIIQFTITTTGNTTTLVHITTIPFCISIRFKFPRCNNWMQTLFQMCELLLYIQFFLTLFCRCVNCYDLGIAGADALKNLSQWLLHATDKYVYMLRINKALDVFSNDWKYHLLSSAGNRSNYQLWHYRTTRLMRLDPTSQELARVRCWNGFGVDEEAPFPEITTSNIVELPESRLTLYNLHKVSRDLVFHLQELTTNISPLLNYVNERLDVSARGNWKSDRKSLLEHNVIYYKLMNLIILLRIHHKAFSLFQYFEPRAFCIM